MRGGSDSSNLHYDSGILECDTCSLVARYQQFRGTYCIHIERLILMAEVDFFFGGGGYPKQ